MYRRRWASLLAKEGYKGVRAIHKNENCSNPLRLIVVGFRARESAGPDSDVDLLVVLAEVSDKRAKAIEIRRALRDLPVGKDIIITMPEDIAQRGEAVGAVLRPALREGRTILEQT